MSNGKRKEFQLRGSPRVLWRYLLPPRREGKNTQRGMRLPFLASHRREPRPTLYLHLHLHPHLHLHLPLTKKKGKKKRKGARL